MPMDIATRKLRRKIADKVGQPVYEVLIDFPKPLSFREASETPICLPGKQKIKTLSNTFQTDTWLTTYAEIKWQGYVFSPVNIRNDVAKASEKVFNEYSGVEFKPLARELCFKKY